MINFIKNDFRSVREAMNYLVNRKVPLGIVILYYVVAGLLLLPLAPFVWLIYKIQLRRWKI